MKAFKINMIVQAVLLATTGIILIEKLPATDFIGWVFFLQMIVGGIQLSSGWLLQSYFPRDKLLKTYLLLATSTVFASILYLFYPNVLIVYNRSLITCLIQVFPWILAGFFWYLSFRNISYIFFKKSIFQ
ncbi:MAG: hypothetical protein WBA74_13440 [Cyclobacteriaceae bacterium]